MGNSSPNLLEGLEMAILASEKKRREALQSIIEICKDCLDEGHERERVQRQFREKPLTNADDTVL